MTLGLKFFSFSLFTVGLIKAILSHLYVTYRDRGHLPKEWQERIDNLRILLAEPAESETEQFATSLLDDIRDPVEPIAVYLQSHGSLLLGWDTGYYITGRLYQSGPLTECNRKLELNNF